MDENDVFHGDKPLSKIRIRNDRVDAYLSLDSNSVYEFLVPSYKGTAYAYVPFFADSPELYVSYSKDEMGESGFYISSQSPLNAFYSLYSETKKNSFQDDWAEAASMARDDNYFTKEYKELSDRCYAKDTSGAERDSLTVLLSKLELSGEMLTPEGQSVWTLYGIPNAAGGRFLIGPDGTILKIDPTPEEVEAAIVMFQSQMQE